MGIPSWQLTCLTIGLICALLFLFYCLLFDEKSEPPHDPREEAESGIGQ